MRTRKHFSKGTNVYYWYYPLIDTICLLKIWHVHLEWFSKQCEHLSSHEGVKMTKQRCKLPRKLLQFLHYRISKSLAKQKKTPITTSNISPWKKFRPFHVFLPLNSSINGYYVMEIMRSFDLCIKNNFQHIFKSDSFPFWLF